MFTKKNGRLRRFSYFKIHQVFLFDPIKKSKKQELIKLGNLLKHFLFNFELENVKIIKTLPLM